MKTILVLRLSSMGDVLLTLPVMQGLLSSNPELHMVFVTRKKFAPYFTGISRLVVVPFDPDGRHRGLTGLWRLFREIRRYPFKTVADLHGILRTRILDALFRLSGREVYRVDKHRKLRRKIIRDKELKMTVPHATERYLEVFEKAGITGSISGSAFPPPKEATLHGQPGHLAIRIGIAPLSKHLTKNWGLKNTSNLIRLLRLRYSSEIHLFGGIKDHSVLNSLAGLEIFNHAGAIDALKEISLIRTMDVFVSMDSANMHLASLLGVPTVSVWGATDPRLGFAPLYQPAEYALRADPAEVVCRPCSVYGEIPCRRSDAPMICMNSIPPEQVLEKINKILLLSGKISVNL